MSNPVSIPADLHTKIQSADAENTICKCTSYLEAVEILLFLATTTRPDISYVVGISVVIWIIMIYLTGMQ